MQLVRKTSSYLAMRPGPTKVRGGEASVPVLGLQGEDGSMEHAAIEYTAMTERITAGDEQDRCDVCGSHRDVAQVICVMESPTGEADGLANMVFICSTCAAYIIQITTGFKAVKSLASWYQVRRYHATHRGGGTITGLRLEEPPE